LKDKVAPTKLVIYPYYLTTILEYNIKWIEQNSSRYSVKYCNETTKNHSNFTKHIFVKLQHTILYLYYIMHFMTLSISTHWNCIKKNARDGFIHPCISQMNQLKFITYVIIFICLKNKNRYAVVGILYLCE